VPNYLLPLVIPDIATLIQVLELKDAYQEARRLYLECKNIEKVLLQLTQDVLEDIYIFISR
jgi:hypothetical protein